MDVDRNLPGCGFGGRVATRFLQALSADFSVSGNSGPTGASKYNPIERRLFSQISNNWAGEPLGNYEKILKFIRTTKTSTGLKVRAYLDRRDYPVGVKPSAERLRQLRITRAKVAPKWNYTIAPSNVK